MATLHLEPEAARSTSNLMGSCRSNIESELSSLQQRVNSMVGAEWQGNSANIFQGEFESWSGQLRNTLNQLEALRQRLETEIAQWEAAASTF